MKFSFLNRNHHQHGHKDAKLLLVSRSVNRCLVNMGLLMTVRMWFVSISVLFAVTGCASAAVLGVGSIDANIDPVVNAAVDDQKQMIDPFGRQTPRSSVQGFINALSQNNTTLAANYLSLSPSDNANETVRLVKLALDTGGRLQTDLQISGNPAGNLADQLPPNQEKVGTVSRDQNSIDLILERKTAVHGNKYWQLSAATIQAIRQAQFEVQPTLVDRYTLQALDDKKFYGYNLADIVAVLLLAMTCCFIAYLLVGVLYLLLKLVYPHVRGKALPVDAKVVLPMALVITSVVLTEVMVYAGVSVTVREPVSRIKDIVAWFALTWLLLRVIDAVFNRAERLSYRRNHTERVSILSLLRKLAKAILLIFAMIFIFGNLGFDLTTGIAALGVGGLALALGAQKMIENLVGSVVVVADQPVRVGDYCKFGDQEGTVIDIGIRSTRIRTPSRTIVTVPNGDFSSLRIENFAPRDMFLFMHQLYIKRNASTATLQRMITELNDYLDHHELTNAEWNQVRMAELRQDCYVVEMRAYVDASGVIEFYGKQNQLLFDMLAKVEEYEVEHALPTQQMVLDADIKQMQQPKQDKGLPDMMHHQ
ncbi:mechanosensitive ion channel family protein [Psychrobacter sp. I-STPA10]|uniref:mechanosensitive ion channel family protein n=1 Tax=Psychrobacter sp. I-STPA10 TaxID=2585769 RepID=UPI001E626ECA|nr:mechanosensitive ion channel domain-containing protein [Psychrobacter sp. I-STPA10]